MDSGFYSSFTGFAARMDALDLIANNLANANTTGFKSHHEFYRSLTAALSVQPSLIPVGTLNQAMNQSINQFGILGGSQIDLAQGTLETTGNETDVAMEGGGFFAVLTKNGVRYTRDGNFGLDKNRNLITKNGDFVLSGQPNQKNTPIQIPSGQISISPDGTLSVGGSLLAKLRIEDFAPGTQLTAEGNSYLIAPPSATPVAANSAVRQGMLESSNSDPVRTTVALIDLQRTAQMMERAISIFNNDFNRTAVQDVPHV
jgi:flagellar basal-body rod protein FlgF/flagellar basal-body rod protein FlgG